jgi:hypothetical protein
LGDDWVFENKGVRSYATRKKKKSGHEGNRRDSKRSERSVGWYMDVLG